MYAWQEVALKWRSTWEMRSWIDAAVEAAKVDPHSWQAARLRSVGVALGGLKNAAAAAALRKVSIQGAAAAARREGSIHGDCWLLFASRLSQCLMQQHKENNAEILYIHKQGKNFAVCLRRLSYCYV